MKTNATFDLNILALPVFLRSPPATVARGARQANASIPRTNPRMVK